MEGWDWTLSPTLEGALQGIDRLACGVLVEDRDGLIRYANRRILELTGYEAKDLDGQPVARLVPEELRASLRDEQAKTRAGDARTRLSALRRRDGRALPVAVSPQWLERTPSGEPAIAERLFIAQSTVRNHLKAIYRKLGVSSQRELVDRVHELASRAPSDGRGRDRATGPVPE